VNDKIVARPGHNMYYWSMENLGIVDILGLDATAEYSFNIQHSTFNIHLNYSFQHAVDHSQAGSKVYGHQIIYTPRHSGGGSLRWENEWVNLGATAMVVGERYSAPQNTAANRLPAYCDIGLSADRRFDLRLGTLTLRASILNILDTQYEVVRSYPMMGRNWRLGIVYEF
jgi:outer membrane receptor protein involved in Fe transport